MPTISRNPDVIAKKPSGSDQGRRTQATQFKSRKPVDTLIPTNVISHPDQTPMDISQSQPNSVRRQSLFSSRRSLKKASGGGGDASEPPPPLPSTAAAHSHSHTEADARSTNIKGKDRERDTTAAMHIDIPSLLEQDYASSVIPERLLVLPNWYNKELEWAAASAKSFRHHYPLHNPFGPRYYKNYHLMPHSELEPAARPPSVFSPLFPALQSTHDLTEDVTSRPPPPSRSPSGSPLPTPDSSQIRINMPRSRKNSSMAYEAVDMLDVSDPWGTTWHHDSPYEILHLNTPVADPTDNPPRSRSRMSSVSIGPARHKATIPSPLSQSTSALHLEPPSADISVVDRKLSRRRRPGIKGFFIGSSDTEEYVYTKAASAPTTPITTAPPVTNGTDSKRRKRLSKRYSSVPVPEPVSAPVPEKEPSTETYLTPELAATDGKPDETAKRSSILGNLRRRLTASKNPQRRKSESQAAKIEVVRRTKRNSVSVDLQRSSPVEKPMSKTKRLSLSLGKRATPLPEKERVDRSSSPEIDTSFSIGKLTVANPDTPSTANTTPSRASMSLPLPGLDKEEGIKTESLSVLGEGRFVGEPEPMPRRGSTSATPPPPYILREVARRGATPPKVDLFLPPPVVLNDFPGAVNDSPISRTSMLANPPTNPPTPIEPPLAPAPVPAPVVAPAKPATPPVPEGGKNSREAEPAKKLRSNTVKSTETFRLVRSPSGRANSPGEAITADGETWAVELVKLKRHSKDKPKSAEREEGGESKTNERGRPDRDAERQPRKTARARHAADAFDGSKSRSHSLDSPRRRPAPEALTIENDHVAERRRRVRERHQSESSPKLSDEKKRTRHPLLQGRRKDSLFARPTSEVASTVDLGAVKAQQTSEGDRTLNRSTSWKTEATRGASTVANTEVSAVAEQEDVGAQLYRVHSTGHGTGLTTVAIPNAFRVPSSDNYQLISEAVAFPSKSAAQPKLYNPLPEPPRESNYQVPVSAIVKDRETRSAAEYWNKFAGLTVAH